MIKFVFTVLLCTTTKTIFVLCMKNHSNNFHMWHNYIHDFATEDNKCYNDLKSLVNASETNASSSDTRNFFESWIVTSTPSEDYPLSLYLGGYDIQCKLNQPNVSNVTGRNQWCLYEIQGQKFDDGLLFGYCLPESCQNAEAEKFAKMVSTKYGFNNRSSKEDDSLQCLPATVSHKVIGFYLVNMVTATLVILIVLGTVFYVLRQKRSRGQNGDFWNSYRMKQFIEAFSLQNNFSKLVRVHPTSDISCLHIIRLTMMLFVICGHTTFFMLTFAENASDFRKPTWIPAYITINASFVTTFILMGGLLTTYTTMFKYRKPKMQADGKLEFTITKFSVRPWLESIVFRYIRYFVFFFWMFAYIYVSPYVNKITVYPNVWPLNVCQTEIWKHLLLIHNLFYHQKCMIWTWYLAVDFQLFIFGRPIVALFVYKPRWAFITCLICILGSSVFRLLATYFYDFPPTLVHITTYYSQFDPNSNNFIHVLYTKPYTYLSAYAIGMIVGYYLYKLHIKEIKINLNILKKTCLWLFTIVSILWNACGYYWVANGWKNTPYVLAYATLCPILWALAWSWITVHSHTISKLVILKKFLQLKIWIFLSNLTFAVYCIHLPFCFQIEFFYSMIKGGVPHIYISNGEWFLICCTTVVVVFIAGLYFWLLAEGPADCIQNCFMRKSPNRVKKPVASTGTNVEMETLVNNFEHGAKVNTTK